MTAEEASKIAGMSTPAPVLAATDSLSEEEVRALSEGAAWYAKYHERMIASRVDDASAASVAQREHFRDLHSALRKLGVRMRLPDGLA